MADVSMLTNEPEGKVSSKMLKFLFDAEHSSVVEHAVISFMIQGASRSWLAQITRHRIASITSSSQHYQDYRDYDCVVHSQHTQDGDIRNFLNYAVHGYALLIGHGMPKEEARQVLPNAMAVNLKWTVNARSLYNFMRLRMCLRNVLEIKTFCIKVFPLVQQWWPEYADILGPPCVADGKCNQGSMSCGEEYQHVKDV